MYLVDGEGIHERGEDLREERGDKLTSILLEGRKGTARGLLHTLVRVQHSPQQLQSNYSEKGSRSLESYLTTTSSTL